MNPRRAHRPGGPGAAALLSLLVPGLGQAWLGSARRGLFLVAPLLLTIAAVLGYVAGGGRKALLDALVRPGVLLALLAVLIGLGVIHAIAIRDAYQLGVRPTPGRVATAGRRLLQSPILLITLVVAVAAYGTLAVVGVGAYQAAGAIFVKPDTGFAIPEASFEPTAGPSGPEPTAGTAPTASTAPEPTATPVPGPVWAQDGRLNLLLIGSDAGPGRWELRSDTMIVVSVDIASGRAAMFGIPRNIINAPLPPESARAFDNGRYPGLLNSLYVYAIGHPKWFPGGEAAGFRALTGTIQELVGVPLDGAIVVNLNGFVDLVEAVGGLWVDVPTALYDEHYPSGAGSITVYVPAGCQKLSGTKALEYARSRHSSDDYSRMRRQQTVLRALALQLDPLALLPKVPRLLKIAGDNLWTTIDVNEIGDLADLAARVDTDHIQSVMLEPPTIPERLTTAGIRRAQNMVRNVFDKPWTSSSEGSSSGSKPCPRKKS